MTESWRPWRRLLAAWLPAAALCLLSGSLYIWQATGSAGREARIGAEVNELEAELARLRLIYDEVDNDRTAVVVLDGQFEHLYEEVFGDLDDRLIRILREVGATTREAGLMPDSFSYSASEDRQTKHVRFGVQFSVEGEYRQLRRLLEALQASPEFLIVEQLGITGEQDGMDRRLRISLRIATYLARADEQTLRRLTGGIRAEEKDDDGEDHEQG
jgi:Tfp pilus assembly protein PilO